MNARYETAKIMDLPVWVLVLTIRILFAMNVTSPNVTGSSEPSHLDLQKRGFARDIARFSSFKSHT